MGKIISCITLKALTLFILSHAGAHLFLGRTIARQKEIARRIIAANYQQTHHLKKN